MSETLKRHWQEQLEFAEKLRDNAIRELARLAMQQEQQLPFEQQIQYEENI